MKAIILAGGKGTRLAPYTKILPKPLMPIGDMPILEVLLRQLKRSGVNDVILTVGHLADLLCAFFGDGHRFGLNIEYSLEEHPLGTAGPLSLIKGLEETFLVMNGDVLTTLDFLSLISYHKAKGGIGTIAAHSRNVRVDLGVIQTNQENEIIGYIEKPTYNLYVSMGVYIFEPGVLKYIDYNQYLDLPDLILKLLSNNELVMSYPYDGYWMDLGRVDDYERAVEDFEELRTEFLGDQPCHNGISVATATFTK
jgi:NDP-mannose synthase